MKFNTLRYLFVDQIELLRDAERQLVGVVPTLIEATTLPSLKQLLSVHHLQTRRQIIQIDRFCAEQGIRPSRRPCKAMQGIIEESSRVFDNQRDQSLVNSRVIIALQKALHYEMAAYNTAHGFALSLEYGDAAPVLHTALEDKHYIDRRLTELSQRIVAVPSVYMAA